MSDTIAIRIKNASAQSHSVKAILRETDLPGAAIEQRKRHSARTEYVDFLGF
jgi:hypothetical protein